jgi:hypothetical protein
MRRPAWPARWDSGLNRCVASGGHRLPALDRHDLVTAAFDPAIGSDGTADRRPIAPWVILVVVAVGVVEAVLLIAWQRDAYVNFSDGVYALSAREFLHGVMPYRDFAAAQPPPVFLVGAVLLAVSDTVGSLHVGLGLVDLITAGLVGFCVWRIDGRVWPAALALVLAPLVPITLNGHAQLLPETIAAPLLLGAAIVCAREPRQLAGGVVLALAVWCKVAFVIPAVAVAVLAPAPRRVLASLLGASVVLFGGSLLVFGDGLWRETVIAQFQVGEASLHYVAGLLAQAAWSELPLVIGLVAFLILARRHRIHIRDRALARTVTGAAIGGLALALTVAKRGSYINVLVVADPALVVLAACAAAAAWRAGARARAAAGVVAAVLAAQTISLLLHPSDPWLAVRPFAQSGLAWTETPSQVTQAVAAAERCPHRLANAGDPYIAFLASRRMPGLQPDLFMLAHATQDAAFARRAARDTPDCP